MSQVRVFMRHIRAAKLCAGGTREWFKRHEFNWEDFLLQGIEVEKFDRTGDPLAARPAALARQEMSNG